LERSEIHFDITAAKRMIMQLKGPVDNTVKIDRFFLRRSRSGELEKILDNSGRAAGLAVGHFELSSGAFVDTLAITKKLAHTENCRQRIVQFVRHTRQHLAHGGKFLRLN